MNKQAVFIPILTLLLGLGLGYFFFAGKADSEMSMPKMINCADEGSSVVWSCAMHPQVKFSEEGKCPFCEMPLSTFVSRAYDNPLKVAMTEAAVKLSGIQTQKVELTDTFRQELQLDGRVAADESRIHHQVAHLPGRIDRLYVNKPGMSVRKGQVIASVYSRELISVVESFEFNKTTPAVMRSAENNLQSWKVRKEQLIPLNVAKDDYRKAVEVFADYSGVVLKQYAREGDLAVNTHMGDPTVYYQIADLSKVWVLFAIYEQDIDLIHIGDRLEFTLEAFPNKIYQAKITALDPLLDSATRTLTVRVEVDNADLLLKPEILARGKLSVNRLAQLGEMSIPKSAVLWTGEKSVVYVRDQQFDQPVFEYREVTLAGETGSHYLIRDGLAAGEEIVINGAFRVDASAQLDRKNSMMNQVLMSADQSIESSGLVKN